MKHYLFYCKMLLISVLIAFVSSCSGDFGAMNRAIKPEERRIQGAELTQEAELALDVVSTALYELYPAHYSSWMSGSLGRTVDYYTTDDLREVYPDYECSELDTLMYIVNFGNERGYAFVSDRLELMAIAESGNFTLQDMKMQPTEANFEENAPKLIVAGMTINDLYIRDSVQVDPPRDDSYTATLYPIIDSIVVTPWQSTEIKGPFVRMKLGQRKPYNMFCFDEDNNRAVVGCVAVAVANVFSANEFPEMSSVHWDSIMTYWNYLYENDRLDTFSYNAVLHNVQMTALAMNLSSIGVSVNMNYGVDGSSASSRKARNLFEAVGYRNVHRPYSQYVNFPQLLNEGKALYISAFNSADWTVGHAWTIDGIASFVQYKLIYRRGGLSEKKAISSINGLLHCNFGWNGKCDGYYKTGFFNTNDGPIVPDEGAEGSENYNFVKFKRVITYDF